MNIATLVLEKLQQHAELLPGGALHVSSTVRFAIEVNGRWDRGSVEAEQVFLDEGQPQPLQLKRPDNYAGPWNDSGCATSVKSYIAAMNIPREGWFKGPGGALMNGRLQVHRKQFSFRIATNAVPSR